MKRIFMPLMILIAAPMFAQSPRHQVFQIIYHSRIPLSILRSQSMLAEDHTYTDQDLQLAMARLRRLPFVYSVNYALEGSTLAIDVADENRVFWDFDSTVQGGRDLPGFGFLETGIGGRYDLGWGGVAQGTLGVAVETGFSWIPLSAQYTQYGLAGSRGFVTLGVSKAGGSSDLSPLVVVGYPLTLRQSIRLSATHLGDSKGNPNSAAFGAQSVTATINKQNLYQLQWLWDTTIDPLFTTRGTLISIGPTYSKTRDFFAAISKSLSFSNDERTKITSVEGAAERFWQLGQRSAITGAVDIVTSHTGGTNYSTRNHVPTGTFPIHERSRHAGFTVGYVYNFFPSVDRPAERRNRVEAAIGLATDSLTQNAHRTTDNYRQAQLGYAFRNRWGRLHFVGTYLWR